jgi:hypothetical protein
MTIETSRSKRGRVIGFRSWDDRVGDRSLLRVVSPPKAAGAALLGLPPNVWAFSPKDDEQEGISLVPPAAMLGSWMESDFTNDDLVNRSSVVDDYEPRLLRIDESVEGVSSSPVYVLEYTPREGALGAWSRIVGWVDVEHATPLRREYYDVEGGRVRTLDFSDVREVEGRRVPHLWTVTSASEKGHRTRIRVDEIRFGTGFDEAIFTTRHLKEH